MTERSSVASIIIVTDTYRDAPSRTWYVGPFLPHMGSAVDRAMDDLDEQAERLDLVSRMLSVEYTFLAADESDARVQATR